MVVTRHRGYRKDLMSGKLEFPGIPDLVQSTDSFFYMPWLQSTVYIELYRVGCNQQTFPLNYHSADLFILKSKILSSQIL